MEALGAPFFGAPSAGILGRGTKKVGASRRDAGKLRGTSVPRGLSGGHLLWSGVARPCPPFFDELVLLYVEFCVHKVHVNRQTP